jgi:dethiobiotin synthetase
MSKYFITSTGTDIGKTHLVCSMIKEFREQNKNILAIKPIISGYEDGNSDTDTAKILTALGKNINLDNINLISPWRFKAPLSPDMASAKENKIINFTQLLDYCKDAENLTDNLIIEGVGGIMVPINNEKTILDLMQVLNYPIILVVGSYLGSISHSLTAINCLEARNLNIHKIIISQSIDGIDCEDTKKTIANFTDIPINIIYRNIES